MMAASAKPSQSCLCPLNHETLSVCFRCRPEGWKGEDAERPGVKLAEAIEAEALRRGLSIDLLRDVRCMSQCKRPCVVAFSHPNKFTYLFGDLDPAIHANDILDAFELYVSRPDGFMERFERPDIMRAGVLGRIPPLLTDAKFVEARPVSTFNPVEQGQADAAVASEVTLSST